LHENLQTKYLKIFKNMFDIVEKHSAIKNVNGVRFDLGKTIHHNALTISAKFVALHPSVASNVCTVLVPTKASFWVGKTISANGQNGTFTREMHNAVFSDHTTKTNLSSLKMNTMFCLAAAYGFVFVSSEMFFCAVYSRTSRS
jgi:hypothetical protein